VQTGAQKLAFEQGGFEEYLFIMNGAGCEHCSDLDGKRFKVSEMEIGKNAPPLHPNCRCSIAPYEDSAEYDEWLENLENGGTTEEWEKQKAVEKAENDDIMESTKRVFRSHADPMVEAFGTARQSNPDEVVELEKKLHDWGVEIIEEGDALGYSANRLGKPGIVTLTPDASYSAWLHEFQHALDDKEAGWNAAMAVWDDEERIRREQRAYSVEIDLARQNDREDMAERLEANLESEIRKIREESELQRKLFEEDNVSD
jgi:hypothetical protein